MTTVAREGEEGAEPLAAAFLRHRPALVRFLASRLGSADHAEDLAQEAYLRSARNAARGREPVRDPKAFLFQVAANLLRNHVRAGRSVASLADYADLLVEPERRDPERALLAADDLRRVERAILDLPPQARRVFQLSRFEGLTNREIAAQLGVSTTAVEKSLRRAFGYLATAMDGGTNSPDPQG